MKIQYYYSRSGTNIIEKYIDGLTHIEQINANEVLRQLRDEKTDVLTIKQWQGKIKEVYFYKHNRIFYVIADADNIYLLHACRKQKNKTEKRDCKVIISRAKELSQELGKKFI